MATGAARDRGRHRRVAKMDTAAAPGPAANVPFTVKLAAVYSPGRSDTISGDIIGSPRCGRGRRQ